MSFNPILLNDLGDCLVSISNEETEDSKLFENAGGHKFCDGLMGKYELSETHNVIFCNGCDLKIVIPKEVNTYGKLRQWCRENVWPKGAVT